MRIPFSALLIVCLPMAAQAQCPETGELLISCSFKDGAKSVTTCLDGETVSYRFGPTGGSPELELIHSVRDVDMHPWEGFGRWIAEGVTFSNGDYRYVLRYAIDKLSEDAPIEGDLWVGRGEERLALLVCDAGSVQTSGYPLPLYDAKLAAGQVWDRDDYIWRDVPND